MNYADLIDMETLEYKFFLLSVSAERIQKELTREELCSFMASVYGFYHWLKLEIAIADEIIGETENDQNRNHSSQSIHSLAKPFPAQTQPTH